MQPKDWFQTLANNSPISLIAGTIAAGLTFWYGFVGPCGGQSPDALQPVHPPGCALAHLTDPTVPILHLPANWAGSLIVGAVVGLIAFVIEKLIKGA